MGEALLYGMAGFGLGLGLLVGAVVIRYVRRTMREEDR